MSSPSSESTRPREEKWAQIYATTTIGLALTTAAVCLRLFTRIYIVRKMGLDDWMSLASLLFVIGTGIAICLCAKTGLGIHASDLVDLNISLFLEHFYFVLLFYNASLITIKLVFIAQYYRLIRQIRHLQVMCLVFGFIIIGWSIAQFFVALLACVPIDAFWRLELRATAVCVPTQTGVYVNGGGNMVTDVVIFLMPLPVLRTLEIPRAQKWILVLVFGVGFLTTGISIARYAYLYVDRTDVTYTLANSSTLTIAEISAGLICACLPAIRPFVKQYVPWGGSKIGSLGLSEPRQRSRVQRSHQIYQQQIEEGSRAERTMKRSTEAYELEIGCNHSSKSDTELVAGSERISAAT